MKIRMSPEMFNSHVSQLIITFAFFYSTLVCYFKAHEFYIQGSNIMASILWFCALLSFLGALRFQIAKMVTFIKKLKKNERK